MLTELETKIGQMFAAGFDGLEAPDYLLEWLAEGRIGAVSLFARNVESPEQLAALTRSLHDAATLPLLIGIDQEGGIVARLRQGFSENPGAQALAADAENGLARTERVSRMLADELRALGINWVYAPVVDVHYNPRNPSVNTRSFGADPARVAAFGAAAVRGFQSGGVAATAKHFPGLGNTPVDTHVDLPTLNTPLETLFDHDLLPYHAALAAGVACVMTTHTIYQTLDPEHPVTMSPVVIRRLLRDELGFEGVVTTDCMEMKAISDRIGPGESAVRAALAGAEIIQFSHTRAMQAEAFDALRTAVDSGRIAESAIDVAYERVQAMKARYAARGPGDLRVIRSPEHLALAADAARAGTVLLHGALPIPLTGRTLLVEFASVLESGIVESGDQTGLCKTMLETAPQVETQVLWSIRDEAALRQALERARACDVLILATRGAYLIPEQLAQARELANAAKRVVHVCLRTPYDALELPGSAVTLCTCGDSAPSLDAAIDALAGKFTPTGRLPVNLSDES